MRLSLRPQTLLVLVPLALLAFPGRVHAQRAIDANLFKPALDPYGIFTVDRAQTAQQWDFGFKVATSYADDPLKLDLNQTGTTSATNIVGYRLVTDLQFNFGLTDWLQVSADAPLARQQLTAGYGARNAGMCDPVTNICKSTGFYAADPQSNVVAPSVQPMDTRVALKASLLQRKTFGIGIAVIGSLPFGDPRTFGSSGTTVEPKLILDKTLGHLGVALNVGAAFRHRSTVYDPYLETGTPSTLSQVLSVGDEVTAGLGLSYRAGAHFGAGLEVIGLSPFGSTSCPAMAPECVTGDRTGEVLGGLMYIPNGELGISVGGGHSLLPAAHRRDDGMLFLTLSWAPVEEEAPATTGDQDNDGITDDKDICPTEPEDRDGYEDADGCPDVDNDNDGVPDSKDKCPNQPEDKDGFEDADGCPDPDNDKDGIPDYKDKCPLKPEDKDGFEDADGCPDLDNDGDGIPDKKDQCPNEPETLNGYEDQDGCPDTVPGNPTSGPALIQGKVEIPENILFETGSSTIDERSYGLLDQVAQLLLAHPELRIIRIEGHTDDTGSADANIKLSEDRAEAVRDYLIQKGVPANKLTTAGYGATRPIVPNDSEENRAKNRRVEFIVVQ
jgi:outer membrane protein OmpA-like peptidoglycan-associated protein